MFNKTSKIGHRPDYFLMMVVFLLIVFGLAMLASASSELGKTKFNDSYYYLKHQITNGLTVGVFGFLVGYFLHYQRLRKWAFIFLVAGIISLALVFTNFGIGFRGASRWVALGPVSFQPAEIMKLVFVIYLAAWLSNPKIKRAENINEGLLPILLLFGFVAGLLFLQPATSTVVILMGSGLVVYFLSGAKLKYLVLIAVLALITLSAIIYATPYRRDRILSFLNSEADTRGQNYHLNQALVAIGSGGLFGVGYGQSATKANYLPTPIDDSIFAVIGEELGFVGAGAVVALFTMLVLRIFWLARKTRDNFGKLILVGFGSIIALQSFTNMAAISGLIPLTGVPLPFISYGGTALAAFMTMSGISLNISRYT